MTPPQPIRRDTVRKPGSMEVVELSEGRNAGQHRELDRHRDVLAYALAKRGEYRNRVGIYGYEVCQVCGEIGRFSGLYGAMGSHRKYPEPTAQGDTKPRLRFVAASHCHDASPAERGKRFCEVCRRPGRPEAMFSIGHHLLCGECQEAFGRHEVREHWGRMLDHFVRERPRYHALIEPNAKGSCDLLPAHP